MTVDRAWVKRNLGFDPIETPAPQNTFAMKKAAAPMGEPEDLQREIIDFDSEGPEGMAFLAFSSATGLSRFTEIPWPNGLQPKTDGKARTGKQGRLPEADVLVVTWTVDEGHATSCVLTPGKDSHNDYLPYTRNFAAIAKKMRAGCPALNARRLGTYWTSTIGSNRVVMFKSDSHMSQDTKKAPAGNQTLPNEDLWGQIIDDVQPKLVITTGTGGGIGTQCEVGDVVVSPIVRFDCRNWLKKEPFHAAQYDAPEPKTKFFAEALTLFKANAGQLPKENIRPPQILHTTGPSTSVVTTDFFGFDTSDDHYKLHGLGFVSEMGDAILGLLMRTLKEQGKPTPRWLAVRNVSDPQIKAEGTLKDQAHVAAQIYKGFGRWSTVCSAIVCWALIAAE
jgi:phosphorylase superfamily protein